MGGGLCYEDDGRLTNGSKTHLRDAFSSGMTPMFTSQSVMKELIFENLENLLFLAIFAVFSAISLNPRTAESFITRGKGFVCVSIGKQT